MGTFLLKDQNPKTEGEGTEVLRGEELFKRLHEHGTFAQVDIMQ